MPVGDLAAARSFYTGVLGFAEAPGEQLPHCEEHAVIRVGAEQRLALCHDISPQPPDLGRHVAFAMPPHERDEVVRRVAQRGIELHRYEEDRPAEAADNYYLHDPGGNRVQLVAGTTSIDHVGVMAIDLEWEEDLYVRRLGFPVDHVVGWRTEDYKRAKRWAEGKEQMAPGTRRLDLRFGTLPGQAPPVPRPNMQLFVRTGPHALALFLAFEHYQQPPEEQVAGVPRVAFAVRAEDLATIAQRFAESKLPTLGPIEHEPASPYGTSLFARDYGANFVEFCTLREPAR